MILIGKVVDQIHVILTTNNVSKNCYISSYNCNIVNIRATFFSEIAKPFIRATFFSEIAKPFVC